MKNRSLIGAINIFIMDPESYARSFCPSSGPETRGELTHQGQKYSLQVRSQSRFHWVKKRSRHCCRNSPEVTFGPPLLKGGRGGFLNPALQENPPIPPFSKGGNYCIVSVNVILDSEVLAKDI
jgi:hypothetical protein